MINLAELVNHSIVRTLPWKMPALRMRGRLFHICSFFIGLLLPTRSGAVLRAIGKFLSSGFLPLSLARPGLLCAPREAVLPGGCQGWVLWGMCTHAWVCVCGGDVEEAALRGRTEGSLFICCLWKSPSVMKLPPKGRGGKDWPLLKLAVGADGAGAGPVCQLVTGCWLAPSR